VAFPPVGSLLPIEVVAGSRLGVVRVEWVLRRLE